MSRVLLPILVLLAGVTAVDAKPRKKDDRRPTKSTKANMPRGFTWPPSKTMVARADACEAKLDELGVEYQPAKRAGRVVRPLTVGAEIGGITYTPVYRKHQVFDCELVLTLASFAPRLYELGVREVKFGSAFRNTKVRVAGKTKNVLSRHALGIALDIVALVDADGNEANVERHYKRGNELLHAFERAVNDSGRFRILLTPRNDPKSHYDHFHLEANPDYTDTTAEKPSS
jgi:hypothetical protein